MFGLGTPELIVVALVIMLIFGPTMMPRLARTLRQTKEELNALSDSTPEAEGRHFSDGSEPK